MESKKTKDDGPKPANAGADQPKRRACDECRARKLACSKEADGCSRCKREGIHCNYSVQKPMGRPRKRPRGETEAGANNLNHQTQENNNTFQQGQQGQHEVPFQFQMPQGSELDLNNFDFDFTFDPTVGMDLDLSFLDMDNPSLNFFDLVQTQDFPSSLSLNLPDENYLSQHAHTYLSNPEPPKGTAAVPESQYNPQPPNWYRGGVLAPMTIDFNPGPEAPPPPQAPEFSPEGAAALVTSMVSPSSSAKTTPGLSPEYSGSSAASASDAEPQDPDSGPTFVPSDMHTQEPTRCECFSKLYQALDSLQRLPTDDFDSAMAVTRSAARTAYETVTCPVCGDPPIDTMQLPKSESNEPIPPDYWLKPFQNLMMLTTLLPSISNAYVNILKMVDTEAARAEAENRKLIFKFEEYGGVWGSAAEENVNCSAARSIEGVELQPSVWRMTARALLKFDVYGSSRPDNFSIPGSGDIDRPFVQIGLKDIMNKMEERSKRRHEKMDALAASGKLPPNCPNPHSGPEGGGGGAHSYYGAVDGEKPQCMVILDIAKRSMANLVIP